MNIPKVVIHDSPPPNLSGIEATRIHDYMGANIDMLDAFTIQPPPLDFIWPGFVAGTVGCLAAAGSTGKSFFALQAGAGVASAAADAALLNMSIKKHGRVVVFNAEDPEVILKLRLHAIGAHFNLDTRKEVAGNMVIKALNGRGGDVMNTAWIDEILSASTGSRLIIFDTFSRWHKMQENDNGEMSRVVGQYEKIARETGAAVLFLHHVNKVSATQGKQDEQQSTRGAAAITDNARWQGFMQTMSDKECKGRCKPEDRKSFVKYGGNKENYGSPSGEKWLQRKAGGVLIPVDFDDDKPAKKTAKILSKNEVFDEL